MVEHACVQVTRVRHMFWAKTHPIAVCQGACTQKNEMTRQTTGQMYHPDQNDF